MKINRRKEIMKEIYLLTKKSDGEVIKSAYEYANKALDDFNAAYRLNQKCGYKCTSQSEATNDSFVKVASCKKDDQVIKMRLESVPLVAFGKS